MLSACWTRIGLCATGQLTTAVMFPAEQNERYKYRSGIVPQNLMGYPTIWEKTVVAFRSASAERKGCNTQSIRIELQQSVSLAVIVFCVEIHLTVLNIRMLFRVLVACPVKGFRSRSQPETEVFSR